jgi:hypothetical protein
LGFSFLLGKREIHYGVGVDGEGAGVTGVGDGVGVVGVADGAGVGLGVIPCGRGIADCCVGSPMAWSDWHAVMVQKPAMLVRRSKEREIRGRLNFIISIIGCLSVVDRHSIGGVTTTT